MKRLHIHVNVSELQAGIRFYSALFGTAPTKTKTDYAKWMLDDPRVNFAISTRGNTPGVDHLGIQVDALEELAEIRQRLEQAQQQLFDEGQTQCCYALSEKSWVQDPSGTAWEAYHTMADAELYGTEAQITQSPVNNTPGPNTARSACCSPN